jgi:iron complex outermembrane receptor protein
VLLGWRGASSVLGAVDLGTRFGADKAFGVRLNAAAEHLDPLLRASRGTRDGLAAALDWKLGRDSLLEAEVEFNRQSQPSQAGFSMLGTRVPDAHDIDPRINLNDQPWSLPVVFTGQTASLRWTQRLADELMLRVHAMTQRLRTDDRIAFPFGCTAENTFDRYCSDGSFDLYDFRSEGERRRNDALDVSVGGRANLLAQDHRWRAGVLLGRQRADLLDQAFNFVGTGTIDGQTVVAPDASLITGSASARRQRSTEWYARDQWALPADVSLWLGVRHTQLTTEDSSGIDASQRFTTPWLGVTWQLKPSTLLYASAGQGIESTVVPNLPTYTNANQALPALKSRQLEAGVKHDERSWSASATVFDVRRPLFSDVGPAGSLTRVLDGQQHHRGIELDGSWRNGPWTVLASATALHARRERSIDPANNGLTPVNVPERTARLQLDHQLLTVPELVLSAAVDHEGERFVLLDDSARIPSWTRLDLAARLVQRLSGTTLTWRLGVDNATNRRAWRESPFQFDHVYLYPLAPRTLRASLTAAF